MDYPIYKDPHGNIHTCIAWACDAFRTGWEWYAFEIVESDEEDTIYYGFVHGFADEFGTFSRKEISDVGVVFVTDKKSLNEIAPPVGWTKVEQDLWHTQEMKGTGN